MKLSFLTIICVACVLTSYSQVSVTTSRNDNNRDGQNLQETILTPGNVNVSQFGKLFSQPVDGKVYGQPLYVPNVSIPGLGTHNVVYVVTEHDSVYAFDADGNSGMNSAPLWKTSLIDPAKGITPIPTSDTGCNDLRPEIGITSTPVIDIAKQTMFVLARTKENGAYFQRLHALNIGTGTEQPNSPMVIQAKVRGTGAGSVNGILSFDPLQQNQRPGLLLVNGAVFIAWSSICDNPPFHGWLMAYSETTLQQVHVWNTTPNGSDGGIWQSGTGVASDGTYLFFATGNGTYDGPKGGLDFGDSVIRLSVGTGQSSYFTPFDQALFDEHDGDVGSGGTLLLPDQGGPHKHLLIQVGKIGSIYLINRDQMGGYSPKTNHIVQDLESAIGGMWGTPAWWNNNVYFGGQFDNLRQYSFDPVSGLLSLTAVAISPTYFKFPGPTPSISANGNSDAIVWALQNEKSSGGPTVLHAYDASDISTELYNSQQDPTRDNPGPAVKFTVPTVANGKVYIGTGTQLSVFGLLPAQLH